MHSAPHSYFFKVVDVFTLGFFETRYRLTLALDYVGKDIVTALEAFKASLMALEGLQLTSLCTKMMAHFSLMITSM